MSTSINAHLHNLDDAPIRAAASGNDGVEWITLFFWADTELTVFMPFARAQRLADAINDAEEITRAEIEAAAVPPGSEEVVF